MDGDTIWHLQAIPLTPIHVGDGTVLDPADFLLRERTEIPEWMYDEYDDDDPRLQVAAQPAALLPFNWHSAFDAMPPKRRAGVLEALNAGRIREGVAALKANARPLQEVDTVELSDQSFAHLSKGFDDPKSRVEVRRHLRSGGRPTIPGSSIKGVIRTAWLNHRANADPMDLSGYGGRPEALEANILNFNQTESECDPFRDVNVDDLLFPSNQLRIEKVARLKRKNEEIVYEKGRDSYLETVKIQDQAEGAVFRIRVTSQNHQRRARSYDPSKTPVTELDLDSLWDAIRRYGEAIWRYEARRFWTLAPRIDRWLRERRRAVTQDALAEDCALVRVGAHGHFESKSIEALRANPHHKTGRLRSEGLTRAVAELDDVDVPFGWMLLMRLKAPS